MKNQAHALLLLLCLAIGYIAGSSRPTAHAWSSADRVVTELQGIRNALNSIHQRLR